MTDGQKIAFHLGGNEEHLIVSADGEILQGELLNKFCERLNAGDGLPATADVASVEDKITGHAAIYVDGTIVVERDYTLHARNVAEHTKNKQVRLTHVPVELPNDSDFPYSLEECLKYQVNEGADL